MSETLINEMLATTYQAGGRGPSSYDCWGMVIHVCTEMSWPVPRDPLLFSSDDPKEVMRIFRTQVIEREWRRCEAKAGAVAFKGSLLKARHAGIVINGGVLHTIEPISTRSGGPEFIPLDELTGRWEFARWAS